MTILLALAVALTPAASPAQAAPAAARVDSAPALTAIAGAFFALSVADLAASTRWYQEKLGMRTLMQLPARDGSSGVVLEGGGLVVELIAREGSRSIRTLAPDVTHDVQVHGLYKVGIFVEDLDRTVATLRARGVAFAFGPFPARGPQPANAGIRDGEGNLIQLFGRP